jgi:hypothetical protein
MSRERCWVLVAGCQENDVQRIFAHACQLCLKTFNSSQSIRFRRLIGNGGNLLPGGGGVRSEENGRMGEEEKRRLREEGTDSKFKIQDSKLRRLQASGRRCEI